MILKMGAGALIIIGKRSAENDLVVAKWGLRGECFV